jgi:hypothetical protein
MIRTVEHQSSALIFVMFRTGYSQQEWTLPVHYQVEVR